MTLQVRSLLQSFNNLLNARHSILSEFDDAITYVNELFKPDSNDAKRTSIQLLETQRILETKKSYIDLLDFQLTNVMCDRDSLRSKNKALHKQ